MKKPHPPLITHTSTASLAIHKSPFLPSPNSCSAHIIPFPFNTNTATTPPTTTTKNTSQKAQHMYVLCLALRCCPSSQESLCDASAVMVVQKRNALLGRPLSDTPRLSLLPLGCFDQRREDRCCELGCEWEGVKDVERGVEGAVGGCEDRPNRKREARWEKRFVFWDEREGDGGRLKCADLGVLGEGEGAVRAGSGQEGSLRSAMDDGCFFSSSASASAFALAAKNTLRVVAAWLLLRAFFLPFSPCTASGRNALAGADNGRVKAAAGKVGGAANAGDKWHCEVGVVAAVAEAGESMGEERDTTYACLVGSRFPPLSRSLASIAASSLWTATLKRLQKLGSWTMADMKGGGFCWEELVGEEDRRMGGERCLCDGSAVCEGGIKGWKRRGARGEVKQCSSGAGRVWVESEVELRTFCDAKLSLYHHEKTKSHQFVGSRCACEVVFVGYKKQSSAF